MHPFWKLARIEFSHEHHNHIILLFSHLAVQLYVIKRMHKESWPKNNCKIKTTVQVCCHSFHRSSTAAPAASKNKTRFLYGRSNHDSTDVNRTSEPGLSVVQTSNYQGMSRQRPMQMSRPGSTRDIGMAWRAPSCNLIISLIKGSWMPAEKCG